MRTYSASVVANLPHLTVPNPERSPRSRSTAACGRRPRHARRKRSVPACRDAGLRSQYGATMATLELIAREASERDNNRSPVAERMDRLDEMLSRYLGPTVIGAM